jgi:hypothetical protein
MPTLLAKKNKRDMTPNDQVHESLAADPDVRQFPQDSKFEDFSALDTPFTQSMSRRVDRYPNSNSSASDALKSSGGAMHDGPAKASIEADKGFSDFINKRWRPLMAIQYMITCFTDFVLFPILWSILQALQGGQVTSQWIPLTLQGAGLYHIAMGVVLGLAAYGRSQEKIAGRAV